MPDSLFSPVVRGDFQCWLRAIVAWGVMLIPLAAEVVWDASTWRMDAKPEDESLLFSCTFTVVDGPVAFLATDVPCGCASAQFDKDAYKNGDHGVFSVRVLIEDRVGEQDLEITPTTADPLHPCDSVKLVAVIPELLRLSKRIVVWDTKTESGPQRLICTVAPGYVVTTATATSGHTSVTASVTQSSDPQIFYIDLALASADHHAPVRISVATDLPVKRQATATLWAVNRLP